MMLNTIKTLTAAGLLAATAAASAGTSPFTLVSGATAPGVDVSLTIQQSSMPGYDYDFVVSNNSLGGIVTGVYFEQLWNGKVWGAGTSFGDADFNPASLSPTLDGWMGSKSSHTVGTQSTIHYIGRGHYYTYSPMIEDGIVVGGSQVFSFKTDTSIISLSDLEDVVGTDGFGVAIRMHDLTSNPYEAGFGEVQPVAEDTAFFQAAAFSSDEELDQAEVTGAPTPTAAIAGIAMVGILGLRRRRK